MARLPFEILFENDFFVAVNKPSGMLSVPDREGIEVSLKDILKQHYGQIFAAHRLDKETSGVIIFAKDESTHKHLSAQFEGRDVEKYYTGLVMGQPAHQQGSVDAPIMEHPVKRGVMVTNKKGKTALTDYQAVESFGAYTLMSFRIHTGRTHQIRVHMKHIGNPIVCDAVYGSAEPVLLSSIKRKFNLSKNEEEERPLFNRLALHAEKIVFTDQQKNRHEIEAPLLKDFRALLTQLRKWKK